MQQMPPQRDLDRVTADRLEVSSTCCVQSENTDRTLLNVTVTSAVATHNQHICSTLNGPSINIPPPVT